GGDIIRWRSAFERSADDLDSLASALMQWTPEMEPGDSADVYLLLPLGGGSRSAALGPPPDDPQGRIAAILDGAAGAWRKRLAMPKIDGPFAVDTMARAIRSSLGYILINRDGAA